MQHNQTLQEKLKGKHLLLVEDNHADTLYIQALLAPYQPIITVAKNGQEAITAYQQHTPDLILMDIQMPIMDGYEATKAIRKQDQQVPIIATSAYADPSHVAEGLAAGCTDYLTKPIFSSRLTDTIDKHLISGINRDS